MKNVLMLSLIFLALCSLLGFVIFFNQNTDYEFESLILQDNMMLRMWNRSGYVFPPVLPLQGAQDALGVAYEQGNDIVQHKIYQYKNKLLASFFFWFNDKIYFPLGSWNWTDLGYKEKWELNGDAEKVRCGVSDEPLLGSLCVAVIRYGPIISEFSSPIEKDVMSHEEFKAIVIAIDDRIASCIQSPNIQR